MKYDINIINTVRKFNANINKFLSLVEIPIRKQDHGFVSCLIAVLSLRVDQSCDIRTVCMRIIKRHDFKKSDRIVHFGELLMPLDNLFHYLNFLL